MPSSAAGDPAGAAAEDGDGARGRAGQADRQVQQGGLAGAVRSDQGGHVPVGYGQRAVAQRPRAAVAFPDCVGFDDVHATPSVSRSRRRGGRRPALALIEIPQLAGKQRHHPVLVQAGPVRGGQPARQGAAKDGQLGQRHLAQGGLNERALPGPACREALELQVAVGLQHRVGVDGQRGDHVADLGKLVTGLEVAQPQGVLDLVHQLQKGRHARGGVEPELDRRRGRCPPGRGRIPIPAASARRGDAFGLAHADPFIYIHRSTRRSFGRPADSLDRITSARSATTTSTSPTRRRRALTAS